MEGTPCDWQWKRATVFYYSICTINKEYFFAKACFYLACNRAFISLIKMQCFSKKKKWERLVGKNSKVEKVLQKKKKITSFSKAYFIKNNFAMLKISTGFLSSQVVCGHIIQRNRERPTFSLK